MKKQIFKTVLKVFITAFLGLAMLLLVLFVSSVIAGFIQIDKNTEYQDKHLEYLKNEYYNGSYAPCDEQKLADFDIEKAFSEGVHRIFAECDPCNRNSWRLLESLGFAREAHFHQNVYFRKDDKDNPIWKDTFVYSLLGK